MKRKSDVFNLVSLLLDNELIVEIRRMDHRLFFTGQSKSLSHKHRKMFKIQRRLEDDFYCSKINISFWTKNKVQDLIAEYKMRSNDLAGILSSIRLLSITEDGKKNEVRKKIFQYIEKKDNIEVEEIF